MVRKAFTIMEMVVALGILAIVLSFAGAIFRVSTESHRLALANGEIMQKFRAITEQLDADFRGLRKDGEIMVFWRAARKDPANTTNNAEEAFDRFDRIMFFADGDFQTYGTDSQTGKPIHSNMARICYTLACTPTGDPADPNRPEAQLPQRRILARSEHLLVPPATTATPFDPLGMAKFSDNDWRNWMNKSQTDAITMQGWELIDAAQKADIISVLGGVEVGVGNSAMSYHSTKNSTVGGLTLDLGDPQSLHAFLCRGVGTFAIQGWSDAEQRWIPSVNPNRDASLKDDSDFVLEGDKLDTSAAAGQWSPHTGSDLDPRLIPGLTYPNGPEVIGNTPIPTLDKDFNRIPGLGRALKFTFTLYDSRGLIKNGRTFTHIVYLDN